MEAGALVMPIDLFEEDAHDRAMRLVADEQLFLKWPKLAAREVALDSRRGLAHLDVGEEHRRRDELRNLFRFKVHPAAGLRHLRRGPKILRLGLLVPLEAVG